MIRAVIDTNVLVSALLSPSRNESLIVLAIQQNVIDSVILLIRSSGESVQAAAPLQAVSPDPSDDKFLACAGSAGVEFKRLGTIRLVNAGELLDRITLEL